MSGQQATTIAGQFIGGYFGGAFGAAAGGLIGGVIGGALFNRDKAQEPEPELADAEVQTSSYGGAIPILFGTMRFAGNVIWQSAIRTIVTETELESPGKGGAPSQVRKDTTYEVDVAIAICEGTIDRIERIFAGGVLIYDAAIATAMPAGVYLRDFWVGSIAEYAGSETQQVDPTIEAAVGVGNASAYRGTAYVVMQSLNLSALKTAVLPSFEFVVTRGGRLEQYHSKISVRPTYFIYEQENILFPPTAGYPVVRISDGVVRISSLTQSAEVWDINGIPTAGANQEEKVELYDLAGRFLGLDVRDEYERTLPSWLIEDNSNPAPFLDQYYGQWTMHDGTPVYAIHVQGALATESANWEYYFRAPYSDIRLSDVIPIIGDSPTPRISAIFCADNRHILVTIYASSLGAGQAASYWYLVEWDNGALTLLDEGPSSAPGIGFGVGSPHGNGIGMASAMLESDLRHVWIHLLNHVRVYEIDATTNELRYKVDFTETVLDAADQLPADVVSSVGGDSTASSAIFADHSICVVVATDELRFFQRDVEIETAGLPLSQVVEELCVRSGIPSDQLDVVGLDAGDSPAPLSTTVLGFLIAKTMNARAAIEKLRPGYFFDAVDGDKLKFVLRGASATETFEQIYLGAGEDQEDERAVASQVEQETEVPARVNVRYIGITSDYQWAAQSARREVTGSSEIYDAEIPCAFYDWQAALIAENNLRDIWASAGKRAFSTGIRYAGFEPTDVVFVDDGERIRQVRLMRREDRGSLISWEAEDIDALMYESRSNQIDFGLGVPSQPIGNGVPTDVEVLDLPPLTELPLGHEVAVYVAARAFAANNQGWAGAYISISRDGGVRFSPAANIQYPSVMGVTLGALRDFTGGNVFDQTSRIRVYINNGELNSATFDEVLSGANGAVIGDEIVQFCNASLVAANIYELTSFLRGRKGTEWAITGHAPSERFVLLTTKLRDIALDIGDRNSELLMVRAAGTGTAARFATTEPFDTQLARVMPYSPVHAFAVRLPSGAWHLRWHRRDRYMNDWNSGVDVPLSEADEIYEVEVYDAGGDLVETYRGIEGTSLLVPADVLGASPTIPSITFKVWQISALVGRGFVSEQTITQTFT